MNNIISGFIVITCLLLVQTCTATTIFIEDCTAGPDSIVTVPVMFSDIENYGAGSVHIVYDPAVVQINEILGSSDSAVSASYINNTLGTTSISAWNVNGISGSIIFANMVLQSTGSSGDSCTLGITVDDLMDESYVDIEPDVINAVFTISQSSGNADKTSSPASSSTQKQTPPLPEYTQTETETEPGSTAEPDNHQDPTQTPDNSSHPVQAQDTSNHTPGFGISMCFSIFILIKILKWKI